MRQAPLVAVSPGRGLGRLQGETNLVRAASAVVRPRPEPVSLRPALAAVEAGPVVDPPSRGSDQP